MADDLMDFTEAGNVENSLVVEQDENDIPVAPGLVQSPVIVNSILKQSNKDNLIQLYTPVQKPEKGRLKVHFGHDSLLQTPNVKPVKKKVSVVVPIKEESENSLKGVQFDVEDKENMPERTSHTEVTKKTEDANTGVEVGKGNCGDTEMDRGVDVAKGIVDYVIDQVPIKDDIDSSRSSGDSGIDESAMEVSVCEPQTYEGTSDPALDQTNDILRQAELLLESLQGGGSYTTDTASDEPSSTLSQAEDEGIEEKADTEVKNEEQTSEATIGRECQTRQEKSKDVALSEEDVVVSQSNESVIPEREHKENEDVKVQIEKEKEKEQAIPVVASNEEEPMECEEAMDVDDDEIVFNIVKNKTVDNLNVAREEKIVNQSGEVLEERNVEDEKIPEITSEGGVESVGNVEIKVVDEVVDSGSDKRNEIDHVKLEDIDKEEKNLFKVNCVEEAGHTSEGFDNGPKIDAQKAADILQVSDDPEVNMKKGRDVKKTKDDSSDEEFLSADEDMEVDEVKTPLKTTDVDEKIQQNTETEPKQESPERIPPKVGYNLNFDELEAMDPFAIKKSLVNSPDLGKQVVKKNNEVKEEVTEFKADSNDVALETVNEKSDINEQFKSAHTSPVKSEPPKAEILLSPNAVLVDEVCRDKTAGDIFNEKPDCLLPDDSKPTDDTENLTEKDNSGSEQTLKKSVGPDTKKELDFDNLDPFKPKIQIVNTPDKAKQEQETRTKSDDPFKPSNQIMNTPEKTTVKDQALDTKTESQNDSKIEEMPSREKENEEPPKIDEEVSVTPHKIILENQHQPMTSPEIPITKGAYNLDVLDLDDIDPFKPKKQMINSPGGNNGSAKPVDVDPFKPKKQIQNSPVAKKVMCETKPEDSGPFKPETQLVNSPVSKAEVSEIAEKDIDNICAPQPETEVKPKDKIVQMETLDDIIDPLKTNSHVNNSPIKEKGNITDTGIDPFKPKSQIQNSPVKAVPEESLNSINFECLDSIDPFKPQKQMENSPAGKTSESNIIGLETESLNNTDPFKSNSKVQNSPSKQETEVDLDILDLESVENPFMPKHQMQNSPTKESNLEIKEAEGSKSANPGTGGDTTLTEDNLDPFADVDPFKSKKQLAMSPQTKSDSQIDPFADLNPFQTKNMVSNTPEKKETTDVDKSSDDLSSNDPFKSQSKVANSPDLQTIEENPFVSKSRIADTPTKEDDPFAQKFEIPTTPTNEPVDVLGDIFEVQGVTRRGQEVSQANQFGDIDESQFVSASQVFNDPAAWEMLEKLGNASTDTAESALSRMSLYVKFDPLVDEAPLNKFDNPRRISIRVSQLEKVKEYGLDETLLLLGTPPKKRRQSMARNTPSGPKSATSMGPQPASKKAEPMGVSAGAVDLILAYSPKEKESQEKGESNPEGPIMRLMDDVESSENLFQELKYTDADIKRFQRDNKLAMQGMLINKDKELCKKEKQWEQEKAEMIKKYKQLKQDRDKLEQAFLILEQTVCQIAAARDASEKKVQEVVGEKEQAVQDIQAVETAFSDLHRRYEKAKTMIISMKKNEETLKKHAADSQEKQKKLNDKLHALEKSTQEQLAMNKQEIEKLEQQRDSVQSKSEAQMKITLMKVENLETSLQRKTEENKQLTEICDNLLAKVGQ